MRDLRHRLASALGDGYRLGRELTGGGMSRVFLAEEIALHREVVVKVLSPELVGEDHVERFRQEILQTARLQHPSIVPLLAAGTVEYRPGQHGPYYIMPYIRGETLRSRLDREGPFAPSGALRMLRDVLEGLVNAHRHGVIHRDIKPENVFVAAGHAVVTDFGIAKALSGLDDPGAEPRPGMVFGSPAYMAPEQALGDPAGDHRIDIYQVGLLGYELLTGRPPFHGLTTRETVASHARTPPAPLSTRRTDIPPVLADALMRCLAKDPGARWQSADELLRVLEAVNVTDHVSGSAPASPASGRRRARPAVIGAGIALLAAVGLAARGLWPIPDARAVTLAVLVPAITGDTGFLQPLAAELQEEVTHGLRYVPGLEVLDFLAVEGLENERPRELADRLGVRYLVRTTLLPIGAGARVGVNLVDARTAVQLWSHTFEVEAPDRFDQAHLGLADSIAQRLGLGPPPVEAAERYQDRPSRTGAAYALYRDARKAIRLRTRDSLRSAMALLEEAIGLNPDFADAHAELANAYILSVVWSYRLPISPFEAAARALAHADRAIALAPTMARAYTARAYIRNQLLAPVAEVRADFDRARELDPGAQPGWYSVLLVREGRTEEALAEALRGVQLDPGGAARRLSLSFDALGLGRGEVAVRAAEEALAMDSTLLLAQALQLRSLLAVGDIRRCTVVPAGPHLGTRAACLQAMGREEEAQALVDSLVQLAVTRDPADTVHSSVIYAQELAIYFAWTGEATSAAYWVREAFEMSPLGMDHRYLRSRLFDRVMRDRTFAETVGRLQGAVYPRVRREADRIGQELLARAAPDALRGAADLEIPRPLRR